MNKWLLYLALILSMTATLTAQEQTPYLLGIEQFSPTILEKTTGKRKARVGLITNQSGKDQKGNRSLDILLKKGVTVTTIFAPEHGINGMVKAGNAVANEIDQKTKLPIVSLYTLNKKNTDVSYKNSIDAFIFDIQDVGMRHYTYSATLLAVLEIASKQDIPLIVLDRPNPLGAVIEGPVSSIKNSFLASVPILLRHGMSIGEIAQYCNKYVLKKAAKLHIVPLANYKRTQTVSKLIAPLSPNIQTIQGCYGYSFLGLLGEIQPFDVGVGTENAFKILGLPATELSKDQQKKLASLLKNNNIGAQPLEYYRRKKAYRGVKLNMPNINNFSAFNTFLAIINFCKTEKIPVIFSKDFNAALGDSFMQDYFNGTQTLEQVSAKINADLKTFYSKAKSAFIYDPLPKMILSKE